VALYETFIAAKDQEIAYLNCPPATMPVLLHHWGKARQSPTQGLSGYLGDRSAGGAARGGGPRTGAGQTRGVSAVVVASTDRRGLMHLDRRYRIEHRQLGRDPTVVGWSNVEIIARARRQELGKQYRAEGKTGTLVVVDQKAVDGEKDISLEFLD
jgi:hypothetical protein